MFQKRHEISLAELTDLKKHNSRFFKEVCSIYEHAPEFGRPMIEWLQDQNVQLVLDPNYEGSGYCQIDLGRPVLTINAKNKNRYNELILHEGFHAIQLSGDNFDYQTDQDFEESIMHNFALEAGAVSFTAMVQYEMLLNGKPGPFLYRKDMTDPVYHYIDSIYRKFEESFKSATASGLAQSDALQSAGAAAFSKAFETPYLVQEYLDQYMSIFVDHMRQFSKYPGEKIAEKRDVSIFGILPSGNSLSSGFNLNAAKIKTFQAYPGFQAALDWLNYQRITLRGDQAVHFTIQKRQEKALMDANNPYLSIKYSDFETRYLENLERPRDQRQPLLDILNEMSGDEAANQLAFDFHKRPESKLSSLFRKR